MDEARLREFTAYEPDVFASFVADLWERAGYDCALVDSGTDGSVTVIARHENGETLRLATSPTRGASEITDRPDGRGVDVVVVPRSVDTAATTHPAELVGVDGLLTLVGELDAADLVDDYVLARPAARERLRRRRERRSGEAGADPATTPRSGAGEVAESTDTGGVAESPGDGRTDLARRRGFTLLVVATASTLLGSALFESIGGTAAAVVFVPSYLLLVVGVLSDARTTGYAGYRGRRGTATGVVVACCLLFAPWVRVLAPVAGSAALLSRLRAERTHGRDRTPWRLLGRERWYWAVGGGTIGWLVAVVGWVSGPFGPATTVVALCSWLAVPVGVFLHGRESPASASRPLVALGCVPFLGVVAGAGYLFRHERARRGPDADSDGTDASGPGDGADATWRGTRVSRALGRAVGRIGAPLAVAAGTVSSGGRSLIGDFRARVGRSQESAEPSGDTDRGGRNVAGSTEDAATEVTDDAADDRVGEPTNGRKPAETGTRSDSSRDTDAGRVADRSTGASGGDASIPSGGVDLGPPVRRPPRESRSVRYDGVDFRCTSVASPDGRWRVAWGTGIDGAGETVERVFLLQYEARQATVEAVSLSECAVGDDGTVAIVESDGDAVSRLRILSPTGTTVADRRFDGEVRAVAVSGRSDPRVGVGVRSPSRLVVLDGATGAEVVAREITSDPDAVEFRDSGTDRWLVVGDESRPSPDAALRLGDGVLVP
jgi:hypothetical protein